MARSFIIVSVCAACFLAGLGLGPSAAEAGNSIGDTLSQLVREMQGIRRATESIARSCR